MSRKRKRPSEDLESAATQPNHEAEVNGIVDDPAPPPQPLEFSVETLKQIHTACSTSIPVQQPLLDGSHSLGTLILTVPCSLQTFRSMHFLHRLVIFKCESRYHDDLLRPK